MTAVRTAGALRRGAALLIDTAVAGVAVGIGFVAGLFDGSFLRVPPDWFWTEWWFKHWLDTPHVFLRPALGLGLFLLIWTAVFEALQGRTPGDRLLGIRLVDKYGQQPHPGRIGLRAVGAVVNVATLGLGWLWIVVSPTRRALHDYLSGTYAIIGK